MKHLWIALVVLGALLTGCTPGEKKAKEDIRTAADKLKEAIKAEAEVFHREARELLDKLDKQYDEWKAKAARAEGAAKVKMEAKLAELEKQKIRVREQLTRLEGTGAELWRDAKKDAQKAVDELKEAYEKAKEHFN
jgi:hypothetical protein